MPIIIKSLLSQTIKYNPHGNTEPQEGEGKEYFQNHMLKVHFKDLGEFRLSMSHPHGDGVSKEGEGGRSSMRSEVGMAALEEVDCHEDGE